MQRFGWAMGTVAEVSIQGCDPEDFDAERLLDEAEALLEDLEEHWSRFRVDNDLDRLNLACGEPVVVAPYTAELIRLALAGWQLTEGLFDPTVLDAVIAAGYDRSIELMPGLASSETFRRPDDAARVVPPPQRTNQWDSSARLASDAPASPKPTRTMPDRASVREQPGPPGPSLPAPGCRGIEVDLHTSTVRLPRGTHLDLGGIGKGRAADLVCEHLARHIEPPVSGVLVNLGGDLRCIGSPVDGATWRVAITDPTDPQVTLATLAVPEGAVATSTTARRTWTRDTVAAHHLIDPRTGSPAETGVLSVSVVAAEASWAEVIAKTVLIAGVEHGLDLVERLGLAALVVTTDGQLIASERLPLHLIDDPTRAITEAPR